MKKIVHYQCEICGAKYESEKDAVDCEAKGIPDKKKYPIGLMYAYEHHGYVGIFSIACVEKNSNSHTLCLGSWAVRTDKYPKYSLDKDICGGTNTHCYTDENRFKEWIKYHNIQDKYIGNAEFKEMVKYLKGKKITPQYYNSAGNLVVVK